MSKYITTTGKYCNLNRLKYSAIGTLIFFLAANGFIMFNFIPQHDSLNYIANFSGNWEISLGRFLQSSYSYFRGDLPVPVLIGIISMLCLTIITYMLTDLFDIHRPVYIILAAAILSANITQTEILSSFIYVEDVCMAAAMLACMSIYILNKTETKNGKLIAVILLILSLGLYQAFIATAATLAILVAMKNILIKRNNNKEIFRKLLLHAAVLAAAGICYFLIKKIAMNIRGVSEAGDYHSLLNILHDLKSIPSRLFVNYGSKISMFFIRKEMNLGRIGNCLLLVTAVILIHRIFQKQNIELKTRVIFMILFVLSTLTALMVNIGAGMVAYRLSFAIFLYYIFFISLLEIQVQTPEPENHHVIFSGAACCMLAMVIWSNIVYSNGAYTTQKVIFDRSISLYTRVLDDLYEVPEYKHNNTPVVLLGDWTFDSYAWNLSKKEYRDLGTFLNTSVTYPQTVKNLLRYLGEEINLLDSDNIRRDIAETPAAKNMPHFPYKGYIQMIGDYLIINF